MRLGPTMWSSLVSIVIAPISERKLPSSNREFQQHTIALEKSNECSHKIRYRPENEPTPVFLIFPGTAEFTTYLLFKPKEPIIQNNLDQIALLFVFELFQ